MATARPLYRYIDRQYVDDFLRDGSLLLTTYTRCCTHELESRRDSDEGHSYFRIAHPGGDLTGATRVGSKSYMLCLSAVYTSELNTRFGTDAAFRVDDLDVFADAIAAKVPGCQKRRGDWCQYGDHREIPGNVDRSIPTEMFKAMAGGSRGDPDAGAMFGRAFASFSKAVGRVVLDHDIYFKKGKAFEVEQEFRLIFNVDHDVADPLLITCPEAAKVCSLAVF
jgi:hypothetical protein